MVALGETVTSAEAALELVISLLICLVIKKSAYAEVALLLAHDTFQNSDLVVGDHLQSADTATCPASFEAAPLCAVRESHPAAVAALDEQLEQRCARADLQSLRTRSSELKTRWPPVLLRHANHLVQCPRNLRYQLLKSLLQKSMAKLSNYLVARSASHAWVLSCAGCC